VTTPSGGSEYGAFRDESADPPALVAVVGTTEVRYHLRALDDLPAMLKERGDWVPLGNADEQKLPPWALSRRGPAPPTTRSVAGTA
jgi:hypothetical protein